MSTLHQAKWSLCATASKNVALRVLRNAGRVTDRKDGRVVYYRLAEGFPATHAPRHVR